MPVHWRSARATSMLGVALTVCALQTMSVAFAAPPKAGQIERQFAPKVEPRSRPAPVPIPEVVPEAPPAPPTGEVRFTLRQVEFTGMTVFSADELAKSFARLLGTSVRLSDLNAAANEITVRYRNAGYLLSQAIVPAQTVDNGRVRIRVVEGYLDGFVVRGTTEAESPKITELANRTMAVRPLRGDALERHLLQMNDLGGYAVRGTVVPSPTTPGAATLFIDATRDRWSGGAAVDNRGGRLLGPGRVHLDVAAHDLLASHDRTGLRWITSGDAKMNYVQVTHDQAFGVEGKRIGASLAAVRSTPREQFAIALEQETASNTAVINYVHPFQRSRSQNVTGRMSLGAHKGETTLFGFPESEDRIRSLRLGVQWDAADSLAGLNLLDLEFSQGIDGLGASKNGDVLLSRANGRVDYRKFTLYAARVQSITPRWSVLGAVTVQRAMTNLLTSELFGFGGEQFGRGFDPSEMVGDHGVAGKLELRYALRQPFAWVDARSMYAFYDAGRVQQRTVAPGADDTESARSTGLGSRFDLARQVSLFIEVAKPLGRDVAAEGNRDARFFGGLSARF